MKCMVIDGNSIINRAYYGIRPLTNREGLYTHAVFGFLTTLLRLKEEERPDALCVTFDLHAPTFRHKADEAYKATRKPMPEELRMQVPVLKEVLDTLNIPRYEMEGWEADDLIGTISRKCEAAGWDCVVVTGDKDSLQLITDHTKVKLVSTRMGQTTTKDMTPETFREQYGFEPIHMIDLKALMGDTSDNIPGVPGVGEKTAMDLIQKYGSVDAIYEKLPDIDAKPAAIKKLTAGEDAARHSYWLATIVTDAPLSFDPAENRVQEPTPAAYPLFLKLEFSKLIEKMGLRPEETAPADAAPDVTVTAERITEESRAREVLELFRKADHVTVLALPDLSGVIADCDTGADTALSAEFFFERYTGDWNALLNALFAADIKKVSHNVKDLMRTLLENGLNAEGFMFDTALAAYLVDATSGKYEIGQLFAAYFHTELVKPVLSGTGCLLPAGGCDGGGGCLPQLHQRRGRPVRSAGPQVEGAGPLGSVRHGGTATVPGAGGNGTGWLPGGQGGAGVLRGDALRKGRRSGTGHLQHGRGEFQHQLPQAAGRNFIRQAGPAPRQENENRLVHQCRCAGKAALRGPHRGGGAGIPAVRES